MQALCRVEVLTLLVVVLLVASAPVQVIDYLALGGYASFGPHLLVLGQSGLLLFQLSLFEHLLLDQLIITAIGLRASIPRFNLGLLFLFNLGVFLLLLVHGDRCALQGRKLALGCVSVFLPHRALLPQFGLTLLSLLLFFVFLLSLLLIFLQLLLQSLIGHR